MVKFNRCVNNLMEGSADSPSFTASPEGDGVWMQTKEYRVVNCMLQKIIIRKDCLYCPITSPFGLLTNNSEVSFVRHHDSIIVWDTTKANISGQCNLKELKSGLGLVHKVDSNSLKLIDDNAQLEYFYYEKRRNNLHKITT